MLNFKKYLFFFATMALLGACNSQKIEVERTSNEPKLVALGGNSGIIIDASQPMWHTSNCGLSQSEQKPFLIDPDKMIASVNSLEEVHKKFKDFIEVAKDSEHCTSKQLLGIKFLSLYLESQEEIATSTVRYYLDLLLNYKTHEPALLNNTLEKVKKKIDKKTHQSYQQKILENAIEALKADKNELDFGIEEIAAKRQDYLISTQQVIKKLSK